MQPKKKRRDVGKVGGSGDSSGADDGKEVAVGRIRKNVKRSTGAVEGKDKLSKRKEITVVPAAADGDDDYFVSDEEEEVNRIGNVPLEWYDDFDHIGYDVEGKKVGKSLDLSEITRLLNSADDPDHWRKVPDVKNQKVIRLSDTDLEIIRRLRSNMFADPKFDPHGEDSYVEFHHDDWMHPVASPTPPKRWFVPSKHEAIKINKIIRAIRSGRLRPRASPPAQVYDLWGASITDDVDMKASRVKGPPPLVAPRISLPQHAESYNPPDEYLWNTEDLREWEAADPEDRELNFIPQKFSALRRVPGYEKSILERFERCLDLYLCPRALHRRWNLDPESLLPQLPSPKDLRPFPSRIAMDYQFYAGKAVKTISVDSSGTYLAIGSECGRLVVYDILTSRGLWEFSVGKTVTALAFHPSLPILAFALEDYLYLSLLDLPNYRVEAVDEDAENKLDFDGENGKESKEAKKSSKGGSGKEDGNDDKDDDEDDEDEDNKSEVVTLAGQIRDALRSPNRARHMEVAKKLMAPFEMKKKSWHDLSGYYSSVDGQPLEKEDAVAAYAKKKQGILRAFRIDHSALVGGLAWHHRGLFLSSVCPYTGVPSEQCAIHSLAKRMSLHPLRKGGGTRVSAVAFHPTQPHFFVVQSSCVRIFDLNAKRNLSHGKSKRPTIGTHVKKLTGFDGANAISIHSSGEHVLIGSEKQQVLWFDLELKATPYKIITNHEKAIRDVGFHPSLPLAFTSSTDGTARLIHTRVYNDLVTNPMIIPLKKLQPQSDPLLKSQTPSDLSDRRAALTCAAWHPFQPWLFTASAGGTVTMWA